MKYLIAPYIYPIMSGNICVGQGFAADDYFITAAHIVRDNPDCFITFRDKDVPLSSDKPVFIGSGDVDKDCNQVDVALYKFSNNNSPLHLNLHQPKMGEILKSCCRETCYDKNTGKYHNKYSEEDALVLGEEEGNYFYCKCHRHGGSSGSPLLWENQVVGIMHGGDPNSHLCAFLKIDSFLLDTDIEVNYDRTEVIYTLFPHGVGRIEALYMLQALNSLGFIGIDPEVEGMCETGYYMFLDRLHFKIDQLTSEERKLIDEYCTYIILKTNR